MKKIITCAFVYIISVVLAFSYGMEYEKSTTEPPKPEIVYIEKPVVKKVEKPDTFSESVYITKTGKRYHKPDCPFFKSRIETTLSHAKAAYYTPCQKCMP